MTLGRTRGVALIGRSLEVTVPVRLDGGEDAASLCFEAEVFHADTRVDASRVRTTVLPGSDPQEVTVRIQSSALVDEPVVTVYLRAGCTQKVTRRYVLLADPVSADAPSAPVPPLLPQGPVVQPLPAATVAKPPAASRATASSTAAASASAAAAPAMVAEAAPPKKARRSKPVPASEAAPVPSVVRRHADASSGKSRLKLDVPDLLVERDPTLRASSELLTPINDDPQRRAEAVALWRSLNMQPQDLLRDAQRLQGLEADVKALREQTAKNQASLNDLRGQLRKAEDERYANGLVYGLAALLAAALASAGYFLWRRQRDGASSSRDWWRGGGRDAAYEDELNLAAHVPEVHSAPSRPLTEVDVDLGVDESLFESLKSRTIAPVPPAVATSPISILPSGDFAPSGNGTGGRAVKAEELFDVQQQADFFVSLEQYDQAIEVLKNHISDNVETSALAYLDLFKIYHTLGRREDYEQLRDDFNRVFNAQVPPFDAFSDQGRGLEAYEAALSRIEALWPSVRALDVIEESIFRKPGSGDGDAFDLEAYRELLLLYAIAKDVVERPAEGAGDYVLSDSMQSGGDAVPSRPPFMATSIQPLPAIVAPPLATGDDHEATVGMSMPKPSPRLGLDIDLDNLLPPSAFVELDVDFTAPAPIRPELSADQQTTEGGELMDTQDSTGGPGLEHHDNLIDFELFDSSTEAEIAPKPPRRR